MKFRVGTKVYDIADDKITEAITNKTDVMTLVEDVVIRTNEEEATFVENRKKEARKEGLEIAIKKYREDNGLEFEGKNIDALVKATSAKALEDANLNPDEAVKKLKVKLEEKEGVIKTLTKKAEEAENNLNQTKSELKINKLIEAAIPKNTLLPTEDIVTILKSKFEFRVNEEGVVEMLQDGKVLQTNTADVLPVKDGIENFFRDNTHYVKEVEGGSGGGDSKDKSGKITLEKFNENLKGEGIEINTKEYDAKLQEAIKANTISDIE